MSLLDNAKSHFVDLVNGDAMLSVDVPEWQDTIYFRPLASMNGKQYQAWFEAASKQDFEGMVDLLILRARTADGTKAFKPSDKNTLMMEASPQIITGIVGRMAELDNESEDAAKKP